MEPAKLRDYILHSERWVYLDVYVGTLDGGPLLGNVPKGQMVGYLPRHLHLNAQKTMYLSIQLLLKVIGIGCCPRNLIVKNIVITSPDCRPRFTANVDFDQNPDNRTCDAAMSALAGIFETILWYCFFFRPTAVSILPCCCFFLALLLFLYFSAVYYLPIMFSQCAAVSNVLLSFWPI